MTHAFLSSVARHLRHAALHLSATSAFTAVTASPTAPRVPPMSPRGSASRASARLVVCAALAGAACLPVAADARVKTTHPGVNVSTVLPQSVMVGLQRARVPLSSVSVVVEKVGDRTPIVALNAGKPMMPASTMKLVTTYAGLSILGPDYRWRTSAYADGTLDGNGVLHGNLYIQGTGDPKLVPEELIDLVQKIHKAGIRGIDGALVLDKRYFDASTRDLPAFDDDTSAPYNVGPDPLLYAFKSLSFTLTPSPDGSVAIDVLPALAQLQIDNQMRAVNGPCRGEAASVSPAVTPTPNGTVVASFAGDYPVRCGPRTVNVAVLDHSAFFAGGFLALWQQTGGTFSGATREGAVPVGAKLVATHQGPLLSDIVRDINKFSNNTMARNLFLTIGAAEEKPPATPAKSARAIEAFLRRDSVEMQYLSLDNGSGLSRDEHLTALSLADLLQRANASPVAQVFVQSLPIAGVDGTMRNRLTNQGAGGNAQIKTGTLRDVRAIAGYVASADGNSYVVVSLINDPHSEAARAAHDALLEWVYQGPTTGFTTVPAPAAEKASAAPRAKPRKNPRKRDAH
ncbi:D-alanyl-D-alanine carboxypeptidase/D-alanyl-D-alanine-endopeptidase [bacterium M00.F.Ca.ET.228.01.1.1]|uniref:D-alanyl-D-alanine carboxypeptidase/D-alanyl-D-alanine endopeptidase n=3 Tax=Pseudomonadota TaxID=1224 RepID=UPI001091CCA6|nr:D-alanyl-D-alanine carboxypeptidase/D-alanyl-D-alanine-endopeptidase [Paraburkholderia phenoliruptrix]MBW9097244.1 D-alanyl-D-alanine carboxypeptidase/D-alanyl-D-alanine-endopeptidase [Paraburkholderia phenoliruptrix]TGP44086.1 D-alanyl-D-alanine carboxypeptidase/D-alanyl-D-alanine-endopeptidase [bacterium M00.F.Ca.ET.228.01.1.1]TGS01749.1 D-alanyl-D-alanine carboxypeptidase/D-alanyl-D-alanine-endopeptidase [bacterium M00.F.Ca.ET.191.01.1.1]TGU08646.1 D-alanyl-D-alanine carboxypeptidase/D-al